MQYKKNTEFNFLFCLATYLNKYIYFKRLCFLNNDLFYLCCIFTLQFLKLAQILLKFERYELSGSIYDKHPSEGRTVVTSHAVAMLGIA